MHALLITQRGAKVAMALALQSPQRVAALIPVDNAPVDAVLQGNFSKYLRSMHTIEKAQIKKQHEADDVLREVEEVRFLPG